MQIRNPNYGPPRPLEVTALQNSSTDKTTLRGSKAYSQLRSPCLNPYAHVPLPSHSLYTQARHKIVILIYMDTRLAGCSKFTASIMECE
jgi:hypothetical protein